METIAITTAYIQLNQALKMLNWCESGAAANILIEAGEIKVNGQTEHRKRNKLYDGFVIAYGKKKAVVRGI